MNLILAIIWLIVLVVLLVSDVPAVILRTNIPFAWLAAILCGYNLVRWWLIRSKSRENAARAPLQRRPKPEEPNPDFDFSDKPDGTDR